MTTILTTIKDGLQRYSDVVYSRNGVNSMWILKNSKDLVEQLESQYISGVSSIRTYDFSTLYTTIPHSLLKSRLAILIKNAFLHKNGSRRYKYIVVSYNTSYFVKNDTEARQKYTEVEVIKMVHFLVDNIFVELGGYIYQQIVGIPMGTNCAPLLADLFLYSYEAILYNTYRRVSVTFDRLYRSGGLIDSCSALSVCLLRVTLVALVTRELWARSMCAAI